MIANMRKSFSGKTLSFKGLAQNNKTKYKDKQEEGQMNFSESGRLEASMKKSVMTISKRTDRALAGLKLKEPSIEELLDDPIGIGYLLRYCVSQYSDENLNFIVTVNRFQELLSQLDPDKAFWPPTTFQAIDKNFEVLSAQRAPDYNPKSTLAEKLKPRFMKMEKRALTFANFLRLCVRTEQLVKFIYDTFLSDDSPTQICMPFKVCDNTMRRLEHLDIYGPNMYEETCIDPILTLVKDIHPRFVRSEYCKTFQTHQRDLVILPPADQLAVVHPPVTLAIYTEEDMTAAKRFLLGDLLKEGYLFGEFLDFCKSRTIAQPLLCLRMCVNYEELILAKKTEEADAHAWLIYKYFIATSSAFEMTFTTLDKNDVMRKLSNPTADMFLNIKSVAFQQLDDVMQQYTATPDYKNLGPNLKIHKSKLKSRAGSFKGWGSFTGMGGSQKKIIAA